MASEVPVPVASHAPVASPVDADNRPPDPMPAMEALLRDAGMLTLEAAARARLAAQESGEKFDVVVTRLGLVSEAALTEATARATGLAIVAAADFPEAPLRPDALSPPFLRDNRALPLAIGEAGVTVALVDPFDEFLQRALGFVFARPILPVLARASDIDVAIDRLYGLASEAAADEDGIVDEDDIERLKDLVSDAPVIRAVNRLIAQASDARASDIHIEPADDRVVIRYRIDGVLQEREPLPAAMRSPLVSRIKVMAGLNIAERRLPQDGRLRAAVRGHEIDLRVATAPAIHGESVVMRILDRSKLKLEFPALGFDETLTRDLRAAVARPHGIVLVTGPTGSGKTTTLYTALAELNTPGRKVLTVEDPIEYRLPGVIQTQVNPQIGFTFGSALRSFLRLDPDVMMVGEIRDTETAQIAVQAALTGHMILSTLHTNSAAGAVTRLIDMEVEPFLLSSVLAGVLAQRLVRRLCTHCREPYRAEAELCVRIGRPEAEGTTFYHPRGCDHCGGAGYDGRVALLEFLKVDDAIGKLILRRADTHEIAQAAAAAKMRTLLGDGVVKAAQGLTSLEEAMRVAVGD